MKNSVIVLLVAALIVLVVGAVNQEHRVDLDYVFGTWRDVSLFTLSAIAAAVTLVVGLVVGVMARAGVAGDRRKLEHELEQLYPRLREAEQAAGLPAWEPPPVVDGTAATTGEAEAPSTDVAAAAPADAPVADTPGHPSGPPPAVPAASRDRSGATAPAEQRIAADGADTAAEQGEQAPDADADTGVRPATTGADDTERAASSSTT